MSDAFDEADIAIGLSVGGAFSGKMISKMAADPIIFALANPTPEIYPEEIYAVRDDAIVATGRSDYPNQILSAIVFPFLFRGALDTRASHFNKEMKIACANSLAKLA